MSEVSQLSGWLLRVPAVLPNLIALFGAKSISSVTLTMLFELFENLIAPPPPPFVPGVTPVANMTDVDADKYDILFCFFLILHYFKI